MHSGTLRHIMLSIFHIFLISPLLIFIGLSRANTPVIIYNTLFITGMLILIYHSFRFISRWSTNHFEHLWINVLHICIIAPLLIYVGYMKEYSIKPTYELLLMLGFASLGYHLYSTVVYLQSIDNYIPNN